MNPVVSRREAEVTPQPKCEECRWYKRSAFYRGDFFCMHPERQWNIASMERQQEDGCGSRGRLYEPRNKTGGYRASSQTEKNLAWFLPRPKPDRYKGGMPLYAEEWLIELAKDILGQESVKLLNAFCGMNKHGLRVDIRKEVNPQILCDMHHLSEYLPPGAPGNQFDVILADPPYSTEEARDLYGTRPLRYKTWTAECDKFLRVGGLLMVYHKYVMPNPNPEKYVVVKRIFVGNRTMHLPRACVVFQKKGRGK